MTPEQTVAYLNSLPGVESASIGSGPRAPMLAETGPKPSKAAKPIKESEFMAQVIAYARANGWLVAHFRPSLNSRGEWQTAVQADGAGFPDLVLVRDRVIVAELKVGKNKPSEKQIEWNIAIQLAGCESYIWRPEMWDGIRELLEAKE